MYNEINSIVTIIAYYLYVQKFQDKAAVTKIPVPKKALFFTPFSLPSSLFYT